MGVAFFSSCYLLCARIQREILHAYSLSQQRYFLKIQRGFDEFTYKTLVLDTTFYRVQLWDFLDHFITVQVFPCQGLVHERF